MCSSNTLSSANVIWLKLQPLRSTICSLNISLNSFYPICLGKRLLCVAAVMFSFLLMCHSSKGKWMFSSFKPKATSSMFTMTAVCSSRWMYWAEQHGWEEWIKECPWKWGWSLGFFAKWGIVCYRNLCRDPKERKRNYLIVCIWTTTYCQWLTKNKHNNSVANSY